MNAVMRGRRGKILVVYYSLTGNTARVAEDLARMIDADVEVLHDREHRAGFIGYLMAAWHALHRVPASIASLTHEPSNYALTLIGTPVWAGNITPAVRAFLLQSGQKLANVGFFATSAGPDNGKVLAAMQELVGREPVVSKGFDARAMKERHLYVQTLAELANDAERFALRTGSAAA